MDDVRKPEWQQPVEPAGRVDETTRGDATRGDATRGADVVTPADRSDRGEGTMERDEAMEQIGPAGERDLVEDIEENRARGGENPGRPEEYRNRP